MAKYSSGDVILVLFPFKDGSGAKKRPAVILERSDKDRWLICKITSVNRSGVIDGYWILKDSQVGKEMGILQDSFVAFNDTVIIDEKFIFSKIGVCKMVNPGS